MKFLYALFVVCLLLCQQVFALVETDVVFELNGAIGHNYFYDDFYEAHQVSDYITVPIPEATLAPGEVYRVNVSFVDSESLKLINVGEYLQFYGRFRMGPTSGGSPQTHDGVLAVDITSSRDISNLSHSDTPGCILSASGDYQFTKGYTILRSAGDIVEGSILQRFTVEFTAPTTVDGAPFVTQTYNNNNVDVQVSDDDASGDVNLLEIIPCLNQPLYDLNRDCKVDTVDLALLASEWLDCGLDDQELCW